MTDLSKCPECGGEADNGHDRCDPPNVYHCTKCEAPKESGWSERFYERFASATDTIYHYQTGGLTPQLITFIADVEASAIAATEARVGERFKELCTVNDDGDCKYFRDDIHERLLRGDKFVAQEILTALFSSKKPNHD